MLSLDRYSSNSVPPTRLGVSRFGFAEMLLSPFDKRRERFHCRRCFVGCLNYSAELFLVGALKYLSRRASYAINNEICNVTLAGGIELRRAFRGYMNLAVVINNVIRKWSGPRRAGRFAQRDTSRTITTPDYFIAAACACNPRATAARDVPFCFRAPYYLSAFSHPSLPPPPFSPSFPPRSPPSFDPDTPDSFAPQTRARALRIKRA